MPETCRHRPAARPRTRAARAAAVERVEAYLRTHAGATLSVAELGRMVGLSERGLRNAFYEVRGLGPKRCLRSERLEGARRALRDAAGGQITVTDVATDYGFYELGRFARVYREVFGEAPSATLGGGISNRPPTAAAPIPENPKCL